MEASALAPPAGLHRRRTLAGSLLRLRSDEQLVTLFRAGNDEAFGTLHERYRPRLLAYTRQMLGGSRADAEDVLQDVFLRAAGTLRADDRPLAVRAWLYRVAHNRCIDQLRRPAPAEADIFDVNRVPVVDPIDAAQRREDLRRLVADVQALPEQQRSALLMRELEGLSYQELSDALGVTVPAIKSLLVRARIGLVEAGEARDTACAEIRTDLAAAFDRGVRINGRARRHLRECHGCAQYRQALRAVDRRLNALAPSHPPGGFLATIAKLLGLGGAGSGAAAGVGGAGAGAGAGVTVAGSTAVSTTAGAGFIGAATTKVAAVVAAAAVVGGGAATVEKVEQAVHPKAPHHVPAARHGAPLPFAPAALVTSKLAAPARDAAERQRGHTKGPQPKTAPMVAAAEPKPLAQADGTAHAPSEIETSTGGIKAPDEPALTGTNTASETAPGTTTAPGATGPAIGTSTIPADTGKTAPAPSPPTAPAPAASPTGAPTTSASAATAPSTPQAQDSAGSGR